MGAEGKSGGTAEETKAIGYKKKTSSWMKGKGSESGTLVSRGRGRRKQK